MYGRVDVNKYQNGARNLQNMIVRPQGGVVRRPGTQFIHAAKTANQTRLISFVISSTVSYVLEFGNLYIRFYTNGGIVVDGSSNIIEVVTPYTNSELDSLYVAQSADVLFIAHPNHPPQILTRTSNTVWTLTQYVPTDGPYLDIDTTGNQAKITVTSDITTLTNNYVAATALTVTDSAADFVVGSVGKVIEVVGPQPLILVSSYTSSTVVGGTYVSVYLKSSGITYTHSGSTVFAVYTGTANPAPVFSSSSVGQYIKVSSTWYLITSFSSSNLVNVSTLTTQAITGTLTITGGFSAGSVGKYVEYIVAGQYLLAKILTVASTSQATVDVIDAVFVNDGSIDVSIVSGSVGSTQLATSSFSGVFKQADIGKFVRDTTTQRWGQITAWTNSSKVSVTILDVYVYSYPTQTMKLGDDRVISATILFTSPVFDATDVGTQVRLQFASQWRSFTVSTIISPNQATGILSDFMPPDLVNANNIYNGGFADKFRMGAWSTVRGFPAIVSFHEQRLIWANTTNQPSTVWFTQPADFLNMSPTEEDGSVIATDAISVTLNADVNPITWMRSGQVLLLGTTNSEYQIIDPTGVGLSPTNIAATEQSAFGSLSPTTAHKSGVATLFLQRGGSKLREMTFQFQFNSFDTKDVSIISEHIMRIRNGAKLLAYQVDPISVFWIVCNNGQLVACTYDHDQDIVAFTPHIITSAAVESIAVVPNTGHDDVYLITNRTVNGSTVRYIEMISTLFDSDTGDTKSTMNFLDCSALYSGAPATNISGLSYLNAASVYAIADGSLVGPFTVTAGAITLSVAASVVRVGLPHTSIIGTLSPEGGSQVGTSQGKRKTIKEISARVKDSLPFKHGPDLNHLTLIDSANFGGDLIAAASRNQLFTGDVRFSPDLAWDQQATYYIVQDKPYPLTVEALMPILVNNE